MSMHIISVRGKIVDEEPLIEKISLFLENTTVGNFQ